MKAAHRAKLKALDIEIRPYVLDENRVEIPHHRDRDYVAIPMYWGIELSGPKGTMYIEQEADRMRKFFLRPWAGADTNFGTYKTQREAVAAYIERLYL